MLSPLTRPFPSPRHPFPPPPPHPFLKLRSCLLIWFAGCRARAYMASGDSTEAVLDLERAVAADPRCEGVLKEELEAARRQAKHKDKDDDHYAVL
eukprot:1896452-Rhodomonas_salina.1